MNPHQLLRLFPNASKSVLAANSADYGSGKPDPEPRNPRKAAQPQPDHREASLALPRQTEKAVTARVHLRIVSVRKRLCDPDNLVPKWTIDALRYCGIISGDEPDKLTLEIGQRKADKGEAEHTLVEIYQP